MWLTILIIVIIVGAIWGFLSSNDGERKSGAAGGALVGLMGCGYILFQILLAGLGILIVIWLFSALFG